MKEIQNKINNLRKEIRNDYEEIGKKLFEVISDLDRYLENLSNGLDSKQVKGGLDGNTS